MFSESASGELLSFPASADGRAPHLLDAPAPPPAALDLLAAERAVADLLRALGRDVDSVHLNDTPRRVAAAFAELLTARETGWTTFANEDGYDELVLVENIPFTSMCAHHLLPFRGVAHIG